MPPVSTFPRGAWLGLGAVVVAISRMFEPVLGDPTGRVLGQFQSEAATHAPALAAALEGLWRNGPFVLADHPLHPHEVNGAMFEPITTLVMWPFYALAGGGAAGFTLAWNGWLLVTLLGSAAGAWIWARAWLGERDPDGWGAGLAAALAAASVFVHLSPEVGRTEAQNYPLYALHGGLLFRAARRGGRAWIGAALSVLPIVWAGGYASVFFAIIEPLVALWALSLAADRTRTRLGLAGVAATALVAVAPLVWALEAHPYVAMETRAGDVAGRSAAYAVLFGRADNVLRELAGYELAPVVGAATFLGAALAVLRWRVAAWPLAIGGLLAAIAVGPAPRAFGGDVWGPAALLAALPGPFQDVKVWARIVGVAIPVLAVGAGALVAGSPRRGPVAAVLLAAGAFVEVERLRVGSWWSLAPTARVAALRAEGAEPIPLPIDGIERTRRWVEPPRSPDLWEAMREHVLFRYLQDTLPNEPELFRSASAPATYEPCALLADAVALREAGFTHLVLRNESLPEDGRGIAVRSLKAVFGAPRTDDAWPLPSRLPDACAGGDAAPAAIAVGGGDPSAGKPAPLTPGEREAVRAARQAERARIREERLRQQREREAAGR